eukprot:668973-Amphidinium_carterae.2
MGTCNVDGSPLRAFEKGTLQAISWAGRQLGRPAPSWGVVAPAPHRDASEVSTFVKPPATATVVRKRKLSHMLDQGSELEIEILQEESVRRMFKSYVQLMGGRPYSREEPSAEQLPGLAYLLERDEVPYTDFAVWTADGRQNSRLMRFQKQV